MRSVISLMAMVTVAIGLASCAQPERVVTPAKPPRTGSRFSGEGKVSLYEGQPCASQIMFDFQTANARGIVQLAAPMPESKVLTEAANRHRRVGIRGNWRIGPERGCSYVSVTNVELF